MGTRGPSTIALSLLLASILTAATGVCADGSPAASGASIEDQANERGRFGPILELAPTNPGPPAAATESARPSDSNSGTLPDSVPASATPPAPAAVEPAASPLPDAATPGDSAAADAVANPAKAACGVDASAREGSTDLGPPAAAPDGAVAVGGVDQTPEETEPWVDAAQDSDPTAQPLSVGGQPSYATVGDHVAQWGAYAEPYPGLPTQGFVSGYAAFAPARAYISPIQGVFSVAPASSAPSGAPGAAVSAAAPVSSAMVRMRRAAVARPRGAAGR